MQIMLSSVDVACVITQEQLLLTAAWPSVLHVLAGITTDSATADAFGVQSLLQGNSTSALFCYFPAGLQALFDAVVQKPQSDVQLSTAVTAVTNFGLTTLSNGTQLQFDDMIVTIRPPAAAKILPPAAAAVYMPSPNPEVSGSSALLSCPMPAIVRSC